MSDDLQRQLTQAQQKLAETEKQLRDLQQMAPALEVLKTLTDAARARADRLEEELRQARAELDLAQSTPAFQQQDSNPLYDEATGLPGGPLMERYIEYALEQARRYKRKTGVVVVRPAAEAPPLHQRELIDRLKTAIRSSDVLGKRDGDYLLLLSEVRGKPDLQALLRRIQRSLTPPLADGGVLEAGLGGALAPGEARDTMDLLKVAGRNADEPLPPAPPEVPPAPEAPPVEPTATEGSGMLYVPLSAQLVSKLGHASIPGQPLEHLLRSGIQGREAWRWLLEAAAWRVVFGDLEPAREALIMLYKHPSGEAQDQSQVTALLCLTCERLGQTDDAAILRGELARLPLRIPQSLLERNFRIVPEEGGQTTRYTERDEAVGERHERLAALLFMVIVLQVSAGAQPQLLAVFEENNKRLRVLAGLLSSP